MKLKEKEKKVILTLLSHTTFAVSYPSIFFDAQRFTGHDFCNSLFVISILSRLHTFTYRDLQLWVEHTQLLLLLLLLLSKKWTLHVRLPVTLWICTLLSVTCAQVVSQLFSSSPCKREWESKVIALQLDSRCLVLKLCVVLKRKKNSHRSEWRERFAFLSLVSLCTEEEKKAQTWETWDFFSIVSLLLPAGCILLLFFSSLSHLLR